MKKILAALLLAAGLALSACGGSGGGSNGPAIRTSCHYETPNGTKITETRDGHWTCPDGTPAKEVP